MSLLFLGASQLLFAQTARQLENIEAFNRLYGYVKYFHPSDEAANLDWNMFAFYGSKAVEECKNSDELLRTLHELFQPIAPTLKIIKSSQRVSFSRDDLTPPESIKYKTISWQHAGLGLGNAQSPYASVRVNRKSSVQPSEGFCTITTSIDVQEHRNKAFMLTARVRLSEGPGTAHLWARVDRENQKMGFFENMDNRPITSNEWKLYEVKGVIDGDGTQLAFGCFLKSAGKLFVDQMELKVREGTEWKSVYTNSFESDESNVSPNSMYSSNPVGYKTFVTEEEASEGKKSVIIQSVAEEKELGLLFKRYCNVGEYIKKEIGSGLTVIMPLALYGNESSTYPKAKPEKLLALENQLKNTSGKTAKDLYVRIGDIIIVWNIFQHFYPYFDVMKVNWNEAFRTAIQEAYTNQMEYDFLKTLRKFTAKLKDGHVSVNAPATTGAEDFVLPLQWEWIENQLVITNVLDDNLAVKAGDIVTTIDHLPAREYFEQVYSYISAATSGWLHYRAQLNSILGPENSKVVLTISDDQGSKKETSLMRSLALSEYYNQIHDTKLDPLRKISDAIYYIDIGVASMEQIRSKFPELQRAKALICDLRGYPNGNHELIGHLLQQNDTSSKWMRIPEIIYPDQERIVGYREMGWFLKPLQPHLNATVFFIIDGQAISYAESYLSLIEHYKLATIIGQPSAGTNGNINPFTVRGSFQISWTGMKVLKHDGSQHHGIGIIPTVHVEKTIQGVRDHKDEFLNKAIELAAKVE